MPAEGETVDVVVVGAGLVGLATALALLERRPGWAVIVVDKEGAPGAHQSGHNSGVVHAGLYYSPGSLRAVLCREGRQLLEEFAQEHGLAFQRCGKVVVATDPHELAGLEELERRGQANGLRHLRRVGAAELAELEPAVSGLGGLHVPETAIVDFGAVTAAYAEAVTATAGSVLLGRTVTGIRRERRSVRILTSQGELSARRVVTCGGLQADRLARQSGIRPGVRIVPFRGDYCTLSPGAANLVRGLVYPVPDPGLPFLGVHVTRRLDGAVWAGPNAVLSLAREGYRRSSVSLPDVGSTLGYGGFWRLARRHWRTAAAEIWRDVSKHAYLAQLRRYLPDLTTADLEWGPSGVRAQALAPDGSLVDDFVLAGDAQILHVLNAPSPAATASLAIGRRVAGRLLAAG